MHDLEMQQYLFVYGSLLTIQGHPMHNYLRGFSDFIGAATVGGIKEDLGDRWGLTPSGDPDDRPLRRRGR